MTTVTHPFPAGSLCPAYDPWSALVDKARDLETLCQALAPLAPVIPLPCVCLDGTCPRCEVDRILSANRE